MTQPGAPVLRSAPGRLALRLDATERRILASLIAELRAELEDPTSAAPGGSLARLFPPAFPDDADREATYVDLVRSDLVEGRLERVGIVESSLAADGLDDAQADAWVAVLNDARLVLGASLGLDVDDDDAGDDAGDGGDERDQAGHGGGETGDGAGETGDGAGETGDASTADDPDAIRGAIFAYLGWLVAAFVDVLAEALPHVPDEAA